MPLWQGPICTWHFYRYGFSIGIPCGTHTACSILNRTYNLEVPIGYINCTYSARDGSLVRTLHKHASILGLFPIPCDKIPLVLRLGFLSMVVLHPSMILLGQCDLLLLPQYCPNIVGYPPDGLELLCPLRLGQTCPIGLVRVIFTIGSYIILLCRPQVPPALAA